MKKEEDSDDETVIFSKRINEPLMTRVSDFPVDLPFPGMGNPNILDTGTQEFPGKSQILDFH